MDMSNAFFILSIVKIVIAIWGIIFISMCYHAIKNIVNLIPQAIFTKSKTAYNFTISMPKKTVKAAYKITERIRK